MANSTIDDLNQWVLDAEYGIKVPSEDRDDFYESKSAHTDFSSGAKESGMSSEGIADLISAGGTALGKVIEAGTKATQPSGTGSGTSTTPPPKPSTPPAQTPPAPPPPAAPPPPPQTPPKPVPAKSNTGAIVFGVATVGALLMLAGWAVSRSRRRPQLIMATPSPHALLGISPGATPSQIKSAYREKARELHPDLTGSDPAKAEEMVRVNEAYEALR